jgi:hypothetical protein
MAMGICLELETLVSGKEDVTKTKKKVKLFQINLCMH